MRKKLFGFLVRRKNGSMISEARRNLWLAATNGELSKKRSLETDPALAQRRAEIKIASSAL